MHSTRQERVLAGPVPHQRALIDALAGLRRASLGPASGRRALPHRRRRWLAAAIATLVLGLMAGAAAAESARMVAAGENHACALTEAGGVQCWGANGSGQLGNGTTTNSATPVDVAGLTGGVVAIATGRAFSCALTREGGLKCWGDNGVGQLGDGTTTSRSTPADVNGLTSGVVAIAAGAHHACALTTAGGVKCWGRNNEGQVGDGSTTTRTTAADVSGLTGVAAITAGGWHTCAVTLSGGAKCWGYNAHGEMGDGTTTNRTTPVNVTGLTSGVVLLAGAWYSTCALTTTGALSCWGANSWGQLGDGTTTQRLTPTGVSGLGSGVAAIGTGAVHACAVTSAGALKCWGRNSNGGLGDGTTTNRSTPVDVTGLGGGTAVASGGLDHTCALEADGGVRCWGLNSSGQVGDGTTTARTAPVVVSGLEGGQPPPGNGARRVATGQYSSCALTSEGGVRCWGQNDGGQLGDGTTVNRSTPVDVHGLTSGVTAIAADGYSACALTEAGGVKCWGYNGYGQLGDGTTTDRATPVDVNGLTSGVVAVTVGHSHACALTAAGGVKCWGRNSFGRLGDGTTVDRHTPTDVSGMTVGVVAVEGGGGHTCAVTAGGGVKCWGYNGYGQLGDGTTTNRLTPVWVSGLSSGVASVSSGNEFSCAVTTGGAARCWGRNNRGEVGDGTTVDRLTPVEVTGLSSGVERLVGQFMHACALMTGGVLKCWGYNGLGQLGDGTTTDRHTPVNVIGLTSGVADVGTGLSHTCAVTARGGVQCWGDGYSGALGDPTTTNRDEPGWVTGFVAGQGTLEAGSSFTCRVTAAGGAQCWGWNSNGRLGDGSTTDRHTPVDVNGLASGVHSIAAGQRFACALTTAGGVKCWGSNSSGQLGDGTTTERHAPVDGIGLDHGVVAIAAALDSACALTSSGGVLCWGSNNTGQLGDGTTTNRLTPVWVTGMTAGVTAVGRGQSHTCALTAAGGVKCWGFNVSGRVGDGTTTQRLTPVWVSGLTSGVAAVALHENTHTCALTTGGGVKCWGSNLYGQLGDGTLTNRSTPVDVTGLTSGVVFVSTGMYRSCALTSGGRLRCWGANDHGQLGDGTTTNRSTPVSVVGLTEGAGLSSGGSDQTCAMTVLGGLKCWGVNTHGQVGDGTTTERHTPFAVRGFKLNGDFDADVKADVAVYRPSTGTWFSLDSSTGNASYQARGWGVQAQGDSPAAGDFDGDGVVDPTVFRPATGTWFILESSTNFSTWSFFGWGATGDTLVPADYDGDGKTDGAVYRPSTGTWYIRPSSGAAQWNVVFGNATDVPIPGHWDSDGKADIAVYRPSTGTWFVLTSSSGYTDYWYRGWGIEAQGDSPAPGDYDGDGRLDLCVFRASTGTWFILESGANFTTWDWFGWGATGDTLVPTDFDGDGITDAAVYRSSTYTWYVRPSSGATQWNVVFGASGDVPLITIR